MLQKFNTWLAKDVKRRAGIARYARLERAADEMIAGEDTFTRRRDEVKALRDPDAMDNRFAAMGLDEMRAQAQAGCQAMGIPVARSENLLTSIRAEKTLAESRRDWCRSMKHVEHSDHERSLVTMFAEPTKKRIVCDITGRRSVFPHDDAEAIVDAFKKSSCAGCSQRRLRGQPT